MDINEALTRGVEQVLPSKERLAALMVERKITLYQGFDPSMPSLHLGNLVGLMKLRQFQKLGHKVIFLVGDFTGMIGDPTDKLATRKRLTRKQVLENAKNWKDQAGRVLDFSGPNPAKIKFNSEWNDKISFRDLIEIASKFTHQELIERDMFQNRIKEGKTIHFHELLYPIAQAIDSVEMDVDLEIGGTDQIFNMLAGRTLMKAMKNKEKFVLATKLLVDKEGNKVGKTTDNALFLDSDPEKFFEGIMEFPDEVIPLAFELLTEVPFDGIRERCESDPYQEKVNLAIEVVNMLWGAEKARSANLVFLERRSQAKPSEEYAEYTMKTSTFKSLPTISAAISAVTGQSVTSVKNLINQGAVEIFPENSNPITITRADDKNVNLIGEAGTARVGSIDIKIESK